MLRGWEKYGVGRKRANFRAASKNGRAGEPAGGLSIGVGSLFIFFIFGVRILGRFVFRGLNVFLDLDERWRVE